MSDVKKIVIPSRITTVSGILALGIGKISLADQTDCKIYFSGCEFGEPLPMLILGRELRSLVRNNPTSSFTAFSQAGAFRGYADHIGFFRYCGFARGQYPGEAIGSSNYTPITIFDANALKEASGDRPYGEIVEEKAFELTKVLLQIDSGSTFDAICYSIREIFRNAMEHSQSSVIVTFAQCWPKRNRAEIVIFDAGIGITASMTEAGLVDGASSMQAVHKALEPGVTGVSIAERQIQDPDYRNSGFGLFVTSKFFSEVGSFRILSGDAALTMSNVGAVAHDWTFDGTCVHLVCDFKKMVSPNLRILEIIAEGENQLSGGNVASTASKRIGNSVTF